MRVATVGIIDISFKIDLSIFIIEQNNYTQIRYMCMQVRVYEQLTNLEDLSGQEKPDTFAVTCNIL